jgi:C4-dicarboxylate-specific signal transduction histidine kinase
MTSSELLVLSRLRNNARIGSFLYLLLPLGFLFHERIMTEHSTMFFLTGGTVFLLAAVRFWLCSGFDSFFLKKPRVWFWYFTVTVSVTSLLIGLLPRTLYVYYGIGDFGFILSVLIIASVSSAIMSSMGFHLRLALFQLALLCLPIAMLMIFESSSELKFVSICFIVYLLYMMKQAQKYHILLRDESSLRSEAENERRRLQLFIDSAPGVISWFDRGLHYKSGNHFFTKLFNLESKEVVGKHLGFQGVRNLFIETMFEFEKSEATQLTFTYENAETGQTYMSFLQKYDFQGLREYSAFSIDITEQKKKDSLIERQQLELIQLEKLSSLGRMAGGTAHEINNPLAVIVSQTDYLKALLDMNKADQAAVQKVVHSISAMAKRIKLIIEAMRRLSRTGGIEGVRSYPLSEVMQSVRTMIECQIADGKVTLTESHQVPDVKILCGYVELGQVLINLIVNSIHEIRKLEEQWIRVESRVERGFVILSVIDSGPGIPIEVRKKLFEPFFTTKPVGVGTGLGLSVSQNLMVLQKGSLEYDASNTKNTSFLLKIPLSA